MKCIEIYLKKKNGGGGGGGEPPNIKQPSA